MTILDMKLKIIIQKYSAAVSLSPPTTTWPFSLTRNRSRTGLSQPRPQPPNRWERQEKYTLKDTLQQPTVKPSSLHLEGDCSSCPQAPRQGTVESSTRIHLFLDSGTDRHWRAVTAGTAAHINTCSNAHLLCSNPLCKHALEC